MNLAFHNPGRAIGRALSICLACLLAGALSFAIPAKKGSASKRSAAAKTTKAAKPAQKTTTKKAAGTTKKTVDGKKRAGTRSARAARKPSWRNTQMNPTPERYKEIQGALIAKGYLQGEPTGVWNESSVSALRRFQSDQNLDATGKIDSLSLIALGLGASYRASSKQDQEAPQQQEP